MKAIVFEQFGEPSEVLHVREVPTPEPGPGEVRVRMIASPINPSELFVVRGLYGVLPKLPATPGFEGVGVVDKVGPGLLGRFVKGKRVIAINSAGGNWAEYAVIPALQARPMPDDLPDEQVASAFVNPATVIGMVRSVLAVPRGAWLLQAAAGSNLGRMIIRLGKHDGFKTLNVVRRSEAVPELQALGGDAVICSADGPIPEQVRRIVGAEEVRYALDPVGGDMGTGLFQSLGAGGRLLVFSSLTNEPLRIDPRQVLANDLKVEGFWLGHWLRQLPMPAKLRLFRTIAELIRSGVLATEPGARFRLDAIADAVVAADKVGRRGKVLLSIRAEDGGR